MSCPCNQTPCTCNPHFPPGYGCPPPTCTLCDGDTVNNVWIERESPGVVGVCQLDTLTEQQVIMVLERDDKARADLLRVTTNPRLRELAQTIQRLPTEQQDDATQTALNRHHSPLADPFYAIFRGNPPFAQ